MRKVELLPTRDGEAGYGLGAAVTTASWSTLKDTLRVLSSYCSGATAHTVSAEYPQRYSNLAKAELRFM